VWGERRFKGSIAPDGAGSIGFKREKLKTEMLKAEKGRMGTGKESFIGVGVGIGIGIGIDQTN
jgi:hypothetical protein